MTCRACEVGVMPTTTKQTRAPVTAEATMGAASGSGTASGAHLSPDHAEELMASNGGAQR